MFDRLFTSAADRDHARRLAQDTVILHGAAAADILLAQLQDPQRRVRSKVLKLAVRVARSSRTLCR
jgi:hypothetical protein